MRSKIWIILAFICFLALAGGVRILAPVVLPESVPLASPLIQFATHGDTIMLSGILPSAAVRNDLIFAANTLFGTGNVIYNLSVCKRVANASWLRSVDSLLKIYADNNIDRGSFEFVGNMAILSGVVANESVKTEMSAHVEKLLGAQLVLNNKLATGGMRLE